jgi:hypothetical protein
MLPDVGSLADQFLQSREGGYVDSSIWLMAETIRRQLAFSLVN